MGRILSIDYGQKKSGIAVTDSLQIIANGLDTVASGELIDYLKDYFSKEEVELVIIGYALDLKGEEGESMQYINPFVNRFKKVFPDIPIEWVDERFTSKLAFQAMIDGGLKKKARRNKKLIDRMSAVIILQSYLEKKRNFKL